MSAFDYDEMTTRNIGFVTAQEQEALRAGSVFVCGVGGMGGACMQSLVRAGVGAFTIADFDDFEVSNLNRQVFANLDTVGNDKAESTRDAVLKINPEADVTVHGREWPDHLEEILARHKIVVNGMDDIAAGVHLYRRAKAHGCTVVDAYTSPLPSAIVVGPRDPRPEERLGSPTVGTPWTELTEAQIDGAKVAEILYVLVHSSSSDAVDMAVAGEMIAGTRARMSFAPMVITTGNLMAYEVIKLLLNRPTTDCRGFFFQPWTLKVERPHPAPVAAVRRAVAQRVIAKMTQGQE
jgi:hypothetical protein